MSKKLKIDPSAIQKRVSESLSQEKILEQKISEVSTIRFTANYRLANTTLSSFEAYLVCRFGLEKTTRCVGVMKCQLPDTVKTKKIVQCLGEPEEEVTALLGLLKSLESREIQPTQTPTRQILTPPNSTCISCGRQLVVNHLPTTVRIYSLKGLSYGEKWSLRCNGCQLTYSYSKYGSRSGHWNLYPEQRQMVEASDCCLLERKVFEWMASLSNHAWTSFSAFAEAYNETFLPSKDLTEKEVASAFWNGEVELECRELGCLDLFGLWKYDGDREKIMEKIDSKRCNTLYPHPPEDCVEDCKKRGCGRVWVTDGIWKLTFPHCMMQNKNYIQNMPLLNYPDVCTSSCDYGKAFCKEHCLEVEKAGYPTDIKGFLRACSTKGQQANSMCL